MLRNLHRLILTLTLLAIGLLANAQAADLNLKHAELQGLWLSRGDSVCELQITLDSITVFRFKLNGVTRCGYSLTKEPCEKTLKFPSAIGVYLVEHFTGKDICCALSELDANVLKIIYPNGTECTFVNEKSMKVK